MKKLAILMPTYNAESYLVDSVESVLNQTYADFDFYIYDDCSVDNTAEIIAKYNDQRIFYRKNPENLGVAKILNIGLEELLPQYEYIARMDADDWCYSERFKKQIAFMEANSHIDMSGTQGYWLKNINEEPDSGWQYPVSHSYLKYYLLFGASFGHSSLIFRSKSFLNKKFRYNELIATCEDWDLWIQIANNGNVANLPDFLMKYRILENSNHRSSDKIEKHFQERSKIISGYWSHFGLNLTPEQVFEYYYDKPKYSDDEFRQKLQHWIVSLNSIFQKADEDLSLDEKKQFSYLLSRRILDFWERSEQSRWDLRIWFLIIKDLKVTPKMSLIKSIIL